MPEGYPIALDDFPTDAYFDKYKPSTWQLGAFSQYCYQLPHFPSTDRKKRKRAAFNLWQQALEHISETSDAEKRDAALKLMKVSIPPPQPVRAKLGHHDHSSCTRFTLGAIRLFPEHTERWPWLAAVPAQGISLSDPGRLRYTLYAVDLRHTRPQFLSEGPVSGLIIILKHTVMRQSLFRRFHYHSGVP